MCRWDIFKGINNSTGFNWSLALQLKTPELLRTSEKKSCKEEEKNDKEWWLGRLERGGKKVKRKLSKKKVTLRLSFN